MVCRGTLVTGGWVASRTPLPSKTLTCQPVTVEPAGALSQTSPMELCPIVPVGAASPVGAPGNATFTGAKSPSTMVEMLPTWSKATIFRLTGAVIGILFPLKNVALSEGRSPLTTGEPSVVKKTWPLLVTLTALVLTTWPATGSGFTDRVGGVVSLPPIRNGTLSLAPAIDRTSKVYGSPGTSPVSVTWDAPTPTRRPDVVD